ncbi:MAG TPA: L,D-transpeptidase [Gaiellaceae bacterium]
MNGRNLVTTAAALAAAAVALVAAPTAGAATGSVVAQAAHASIGIYRSPHARRPFMTLSNPTPNGSPRVFLVKQRDTGWEQVYLPVRPNGSTGWVRDADVELSLDTFRVVVSRAAHTVTIYRNGRVFRRTRAAVGRSALPTPTGTYFLTELLRQPNPNGMLGPYAFTLSAYSNVLYSFGGGPGQIGLHGTNQPGLLGHDVSHGCIRVPNAVITQLARTLPLGTPVEIR